MPCPWFQSSLLSRWVVPCNLAEGCDNSLMHGNCWKATGWGLSKWHQGPPSSDILVQMAACPCPGTPKYTGTGTASENWGAHAMDSVVSQVSCSPQSSELDSDYGWFLTVASTWGDNVAVWNFHKEYVSIYMFNRLPKLGLSPQDSLYHPHRRKHLIRLIWSMQTSTFYIAIQRRHFF